MCLSGQHRDGRAWADRDDRVLPIKRRVVFLRTSHPGRRLGRHARADHASDYLAAGQPAQNAQMVLGQHFGVRDEHDQERGRHEMQPVTEDLIDEGAQ